MKNIVLFIVLQAISLSSIAQISYEKRVELALEDGYTQEKIEEFGKAGFILSTKRVNNSDNQVEWKYDFYNTDIEMVKVKRILLNKKLYRDESFTTTERLHTLYKDRKGNFSLVSVEAKNMIITQIEGQIPKKAYLKGMAVLGDYAFFRGYLKNSPFLFSVNWKTGKQNIFPIVISKVKPKKIKLIDFQVLEESDELFLYVKALIDKRTSAIHVLKFDSKGEQFGSYNLTKSIVRNITSLTASKLNDEKYIFTGTYSTKSTSSSEGMFFCQVDHERLSFMEYYNFLDLENFLSYLPERKQEKIEKKKNRKKGRGKEYVINYRIAPHEIIQLEDGYIFLGEAYYPTYRTETYYTTSFVNGVMVTRPVTTTVFDGYQYTHAMMARFDLGGKLLWDEVFEMWQAYKPFYIKKFISVAEKNENSLKLAFASRNKIYTKSIDYSGAVINDFESEEIETSFDGDKTKRSHSNLLFWYDNYFLSYGYQKIKNKEDDEVKRKRKVYFMSKIYFK